MSGSEIKGPPFSVRQTVANPLEHTMLRASQRPYPQQNWPSPCLHPCEPSNRDPPPNQKKKCVSFVLTQSCVGKGLPVSQS